MTVTDDYRAIQQEAAIGAVAPRMQIAVAGQDRAAYLQGLLTNDILALTAGTGCYSAWLSPQGRMHTDLHVLESGSMILLDVPADALEPTIAAARAVHLHRGRQSGFAGGEHGQRLAAWPEGRGCSRTRDWCARPESNGRSITTHSSSFGDSPVSVARISQLGVPGFCIYVDRARAPAVASALSDAGAAAVSAEAIAAARIEAGYPVFGST